jgi:hypothetical protein
MTIHVSEAEQLARIEAEAAPGPIVRQVGPGVVHIRTKTGRSIIFERGDIGVLRAVLALLEVGE